MTYLKHSQRADRKLPKAQPPTQEPPKEKVERARTGGADDYGGYYWCVKTDLSENGEIYVFADEVQFTPNGGVVFLGRREKEDGDRTNLALAPGQWRAVFAASCWDGHAVAVEHWKGEIQR